MQEDQWKILVSNSVYPLNTDENKVFGFVVVVVVFFYLQKH